jgi:hypothetical protein
MLFALLSGTDIKRQPVPQCLIALKQKKEPKDVLKEKSFYVCQGRVIKNTAC